MSKQTEKTATASPEEPASGPTTATAREYRFISKSGDFATPWRSMPKDGIVLGINKLKPEVREKLGKHYGLQLRCPKKDPE